MPYRRLPNTDASRLKALKIAYTKGKEMNPFKLAFSQSTFQKVQSFLPSFEKVITENRFNYSSHLKKSKDYQNHLRKARTYVSHFIQVLNMAVQRGELPASIRIYYGLNENDKRTPNLLSEQDVITWGERIIKGEQERIKKGMSPITNPTIAMVKVKYEIFIDAYRSQQTNKKTTARYQEELSDLRKAADDIIVKVWNEVEETFNTLSENARRERASDYGLNYVYRKNELGKLRIAPDAFQSALFV